MRVYIRQERYITKKFRKKDKEKLENIKYLE
jgi:ribosomal protein L33